MIAPGPAAPEAPTGAQARPSAPGARTTGVRTAAALAVVVLATAVLPLGNALWAPLAPAFPGLDADLAARLRYQLGALALAAVVVAAVAWLVPGSRRFLRLGRLDAPVVPVPAIGLRPKPSETWRQVGAGFAVVVTGVTALIVGLQVLGGGGADLERAVRFLPWALLLAASNALVEESITRFGVVGALADRLPPQAVYLASGALFGVAHYWGVPGGLPGVAAAGFLGWLLAKSIGETGGLGWAWFLHFLQDVVIFSALFAAAS